jgi:hypothetical protein
MMLEEILHRSTETGEGTIETQERGESNCRLFLQFSDLVPDIMMIH